MECYFLKFADGFNDSNERKMFLEEELSMAVE
jgi:hypothetical protein